MSGDAPSWEALDWQALERLRACFLSGAAARGPYWRSSTDLASYDLTFGARIGWKWDAVLEELRLRGWSPPAGAVLDFGCGSGVAGRRVVARFGAERLLLHDRSPLAVEFAAQRARAAFPGLAIESGTGAEPIAVLVLSHVVNELDARGTAEVRALCARAAAILWVEPGAHQDSRVLGAWREELRAAGMHVVAPCTHGGACPLLAEGNERHWCHFFAPPPPALAADARWVELGRRAGIDLRSVPYAFLTLDRRPAAPLQGASRVLGAPRASKADVALYGCDAGGVAALMVRRRDDPALWKELGTARGPLLYRWVREGNRIRGGARVRADDARAE
jgi:hypothetical protein